MVQVVKLSYDAELLAEAVMNQYFASAKEIDKEFEKLGLTTNEEKQWLVSFSFAFSIRHIRHEEDLKSLRPFSLPPVPKAWKAKVNNMSNGVKGTDLDELASSTLAHIDALPVRIFDTVKALSALGLAAASLEFAALTLSKKEDYDDFIDSLFVVRECLAHYHSRISGIKEKTLAARVNAFKSNQKTYMLRDEVVEHWRAHISPALSNEKAANVLLKKFPHLSHRKLKEYIAAAKRKDASC